MKPNSFGNEELKELRRTLITQESANRELLEQLGLSSTDLLRIMRDESRFSKETWQKMQQERKRLEARIDEKIGNTSEPSKKKTPSQIKGHWIFVR